MELILSAIPITVAALCYLGWWRGKLWARWLAILLIVVIALAAGAFGFYVNAMGQANWSL